ncbi:hypothetical protein [Arthrobacter sp. GMC3]|uniref:hypothetical protein n=1 Tax=Arthrobacter sp. GMC3 TaxID=2058894 RepID=UPI000CE48B3C|nr:hypothetical protein [Arthrobacter sp. GMC3]
MTGESGPTLAQLAAQERKLRRSRPQNPRHKVTFGLAAFFIGALVWVIVFPIPAVLFLFSDPGIGSDFDGGLAVVGVPIALALEVGIPSAIAILVAGLLLVRVRQQCIHVLVIATVSGLITFLILLMLMPLDPERTFVVVGISSTAFVAAALGRLAATGLVRVADESRSM